MCSAKEIIKRFVWWELFELCEQWEITMDNGAAILFTESSIRTFAKFIDENLVLRVKNCITVPFK